MGKTDHSRYEYIFSHSQDALIVINEHGGILEWNTRAAEMFAWNGNDLKGKPIEYHITTTGPGLISQPYPFLFLTEKKLQKNTIEFETRHPNGHVFPVQMTVSTLDFDSTTEYLLAIQDISDRKQEERKLQHLANHDDLTGLPNRSAFNCRLTDSMARARRSNETIALMFLDIDHFKSINDAYGHEVGDNLLMNFSSHVRKNLRESDFLARLGGDEFTIILEGIIVEDSVEVVARNIVEAIRSRCLIDNMEHRVTTSMGAVVYDRSNISPHELIKLADKAMYKAKRAGRNTFMVVGRGEKNSENTKEKSPTIANARALLNLPLNNGENYLQNILATVRRHLEMDVAFISKFHDGLREFEVVDAEAENPPIEVGGSGPLDDSYCIRVVDGRLPELIRDAFEDSEALSLPVTVALPVRAHMSVPIRLPDGTIYGTFCCFSYTPNHSLNDRDIAVMHVLAGVVSMHISATA
jgi:diguanylate cyclase (GGDEF)-like protein/PAS domain S-box-containing protein